jgi:hypothetical protein
MNPLFIPVLIGTLALFFIGIWLSQQAHTKIQNNLLAVFSFIAAVP